MSEVRSVPEAALDEFIQKWLWPNGRKYRYDPAYAERHAAEMEALRHDPSPWGRAVRTFARWKAESVGYGWDSLPWDAGDDTDQRYYMHGAAWALRFLLDAGVVTLPDIPALPEDR